MIYINDCIEEFDVSEAMLRVGAQRAAYAMRYRQEHDRRLSLAVYLLLQEALRAEYDIQEVPEFVYGHHGKPELKGHPEIHFNLSHCRQAALCVVSDQPVGCDVESIPDRLDMDVCRYCFNEEELTDIINYEHPTQMFTTLWTKKEAFLKLTGEGLTNDLTTLLCNHKAEKVSFQTHIASDNSYVYSICMMDSQRNVY